MRIERMVLNEIFENVFLTSYLQHQPEKQAAVIICAGGGYLSHNEDEAEYVALQFLANGYQAFILNYSVGAPYASFPQPIIELASAVSIVRDNALRFQLNPNRIFVCGLSTGGHLASLLGSLWNSDLLNLKAIMQPLNAKPDAIILGYPILDLDLFKIDLLNKDTKYAPFLEMMFTAILRHPAPDPDALKKWNSTFAICEDTVPTFIWNYASDEWVNKNQANEYAKRMALYHIPHAYITFDTGKHSEIKLDKTKIWLTKAIEWLDTL